MLFCRTFRNTENYSGSGDEIDFRANNIHIVEWTRAKVFIILRLIEIDDKNT